MKWFSVKSNPSARYLPQVFTVDEQRLVHRCLSGAARKTDNRGTSTGAIVFSDNEAFLSPAQEEVLVALDTLEDGLTERQIKSSILKRIEDKKGVAPNKAFKWLDGKTLSDSEFTEWWTSTAKKTAKFRQVAVRKFRSSRLSGRKYSAPAMSGVVGAYSRDANNNWARICPFNEDAPHLLSRVLPIIQRIDSAFRQALPDRWRLQKEFTDTLDPRFVIDGTCFTTITVNKNYRTAAHRDSGDLAQGFSNIAVFSNGKRYRGGHLVLPEFNVEICLTPGDLLFVANHEYIHQNTAIEPVDDDSERVSLVCYAREDFAFSGTYEYEMLRREYVKKHGKLPRIWESKEWYEHLKLKLSPRGSIVAGARELKILNQDILWLAARYEKDALFERRWQYIGELNCDDRADLQTLKTLFSALHFKTPRQDSWLKSNGAEEGVQYVDSIYIDDGWAVSYCETESGLVRFNNNRFNVQSVGRLENFSLPFRKLTKPVFTWLESIWTQCINENAPTKVYLVRVATGIAEAPFRLALTTLSESEAERSNELTQLKSSSAQRQKFYESTGGISLRDFPKNPPSNQWLCDLGYISYRKHGGFIEVRDGETPFNTRTAFGTDTEVDYLTELLSHWKRRALNFGSADYKTRYLRCGTYQVPDVPLKQTLVARPLHWNATPSHLHLRRYGWRPSARNTDKQVRAKAEDICLDAIVAPAEILWKSKYQAAPILCVATTPSMSLSVWLLKDDSESGGQAVVTDGQKVWCFQAISSKRAIRWRDEKFGNLKPIKISKPALLGHLQRSSNNLRIDTSGLNVRLKSDESYQVHTAIPKTKLARRKAIHKFQIAIPTYGRSGFILERTLKLLEQYDVDPKRVTLFVADAFTKKVWVEESGRVKSSEELEDLKDPVLYRRRLKGNRYGKRIVVGVKNIGSQRNFIQNYYPEGTHLVSMDDDLRQVSRLVDGKYRPINGKQFDTLIRRNFEQCHKTGAHLWGLYASANEAWQQSAYEGHGEFDTENNYIIASLYGQIVRHSKALEVTSINHAEDQERSLRFFAMDGVNIRNNRYTQSKGADYFGVGGLQEARSSLGPKAGVAPFEEPIKAVARQFVGLCAPKLKKKTSKFPNGYWDLRFKKV